MTENYFHALRYLFCLLLGILVIACLVGAKALPLSVTTTLGPPLQLDNDGNYTMAWAHNDTHIVFEVKVKTTGYVGFGISHNGKMFPSDVVIGWIKDGNTFFTDRHATQHATPEVDQSQDWELLQGGEKGIETTLKFMRRIDTCDHDDLPILNQTVRLIYSYSLEDPVSAANIPWHGARRGSKSVSLLSSSLPPASFQDDDVRILEFRNRNYLMPNASTTYYCLGFQLPDIGGKHHMIEYEPVFTPGNEDIVHHMVLSRCHGSHPEFDMKDCNVRGAPYNCNLIAAWAVGGPKFYFPSNAGFPVGGDDFQFYEMHFHYNNPSRKSGVIDSSGMQIKLTSKLRHNDINSLIVSHTSAPDLVIPPKEEDFKTRAYCSPQCTTNGLQNMTEDIKIIAVLQHSHLLGRGVTTRHFRNGVELEPLMDDPNYDFNFQSFRPLKKERIMKPGDSFIVECTYNSMERSTTTFGGLSTQEEMCMSFFYIYPTPSMLGCGSSPLFDNFNITGLDTDKKYSILKDKFLHMNWQNTGVKDAFKRELEDSTIKHQCLYMNAGKYSSEDFDYVEHVVPFNRTKASSICQHNRR